MPGSDRDAAAMKAAKDEARTLLIGLATQRRSITYSDFVERIRSLRLIPRDPRLFEILGEISSEEAQAGKGMLSVLVVRKEDGTPGPGFFDLAKDLGRDISDETAVIDAERKLVFASWR